MVIDSYKIYSMKREWNNGKKNKNLTCTNHMVSDGGITCRGLDRLLDDISYAWHGEYGMDDYDIDVEITFKERG